MKKVGKRNVIREGGYRRGTREYRERILWN